DAAYEVNAPVLELPEIEPLLELDLTEGTAAVDWIKLAEDGSGDVIVRIAELAGGRAQGRVRPAAVLAGREVVETDLLERPVGARPSPGPRRLSPPSASPPAGLAGAPPSPIPAPARSPARSGSRPGTSRVSTRSTSPRSSTPSPRRTRAPRSNGSTSRPRATRTACPPTPLPGTSPMSSTWGPKPPTASPPPGCCWTAPRPIPLWRTSSCPPPGTP